MNRVPVSHPPQVAPVQAVAGSQAQPAARRLAHGVETAGAGHPHDRAHPDELHGAHVLDAARPRRLGRSVHPLGRVSASTPGVPRSGPLAGRIACEWSGGEGLLGRGVIQYRGLGQRGHRRERRARA